MSNPRRRIPVLPNRPNIHPIANQLRRSYPVGRQSFLRACEGEILTLSITTENTLSPIVSAKLMSTLRLNGNKEWVTTPFERTSERTLTCQFKAERPGLYSFRAEFSMDSGNNWYRDTVPDGWVLVDPPQVDGLRLYTVIPNVSGSLADWKTDLKRISSMGFNAVHLLPLTTLDTSESPYSAKDLFSIDPCYLEHGSPLDGLAQLEDYIEEAKKLGIRLCFDLVLNHVGVHSRMAREVPDWIVPDPNQPDGLMRARYWSEAGWNNWEDLVLINYEHSSEDIRTEIWSYMTDYALFWAKYANDTGGFVRFDNLHSSNPEFVQALTTAINSEYPEIGLLAEYFADETTLLLAGPKWGLNLHLATPWDYKFVPKLREYLKYIHRVSEHIRYYMPVTSHDSGSPAQEFGSVESTVPRYVAAALLGTGATGIIQGVEYGIKERIKFIGKCEKMIFPDDPRFASFITRINLILVNYQAFRQGGNCKFIDNGHDAIIAAFRKDTGSQSLGFLVVCNFDIYNFQKIRIDLSYDLNTHGPVSCCDLISEEKFDFQNTNLELELPPCTARVLKF